MMVFGHNVVADFASISAVVGAFTGLLPPIATLMTIIYFATLLYDRQVMRRAAKEAAAKLLVVADVAAEKVIVQAAKVASEVVVTKEHLV